MNFYPIILLSTLGAATLEESANEFIASSPAAERPVGTLTKLGVDGSAEITTAKGAISVRDIISLRRAGATLPPLPRGPVLITTSGDRIPGTLFGGNDQSLRFQPSGNSTEWKVPITSAAFLWLTKPPSDTPADPARYNWLPATRNRDVLRFRNGDLVAGTIDGFVADEAALRFKPENGETRTIALSELAAIAFNPTLARQRKIKGPYVRLVLRDGTRLAVTAATSDGETLKGKALFGQPIEIPIADLLSFDVMQGKAIYLADLKPAKVEQQGFLGAAWNWTANRNVHGEPLRLLADVGENTFDRGLGTHPRTSLTYDLGGKYRRFEALVGIDAETGERGRANVRILVDGKERNLPELRKLADGPAHSVRLDVIGAKQLTLIVDFGPDGDVQADVNWADARLVE